MRLRFVLALSALLSIPGLLTFGCGGDHGVDIIVTVDPTLYDSTEFCTINGQDELCPDAEGLELQLHEGECPGDLFAVAAATGAIHQQSVVFSGPGTTSFMPVDAPVEDIDYALVALARTAGQCTVVGAGCTQFTLGDQDEIEVELVPVSATVFASLETSMCGGERSCVGALCL